MKIKSKPSIFNDVIGPVMRGPSSSHTAASWRIAQIAVQMLDDNLKEALVEFDINGVWAKNFREQGTALGMDGGLLGINMEDEAILDSYKIAKSRNILIRYEIRSFQTDHPNTVRLSLKGSKGNSINLTAVSTGGGMFEIRKIYDFDVLINGDEFDLLYFVSGVSKDDFRQEIEKGSPVDYKIEFYEQAEQTLLIVRSLTGIDESFVLWLKKIVGNGRVVKIVPIMPVLAIIGQYPFNSIAELMAYGDANNLSLGELGIIYEHCRSNLDRIALINKMKDIISIIEKGISQGLAGTTYKDRILHHQSHLISKAEGKGILLSDDLTNNIIANITALMEAKSSMGVIVAVPTAGSCGALGGTIKAITDFKDVDDERKQLSYFAAGLIGVFIAEGPGFSAEESGCQVECGAASAMTAAAIVEMAGGNSTEAINAASMAYQNMIGLVCDPVADRVEVPCLGKNIIAGMNALSSSSMALSGYNAVIPLDEVIETVYQVGKTLPFELRCTGLGGLANTKTSKVLKDKLATCYRDKS